MKNKKNYNNKFDRFSKSYENIWMEFIKKM